MEIKPEPETKTEPKEIIKIVYIYSSYTPKMKECIYRYRAIPANNEKVKATNKRCYLKRMENPEYRAKMNLESRERYKKKKEKENALKLEKPVEIIV